MEASQASSGAADGASIATPARIQMIKDLLVSMGAEDHDPKVNHLLLEFLHKYVSEVIQDAAVFQGHAQKNELDLDDVRLAIQSKVNGMFSQPPPREFMIEIARAKNAVPLPILTPGVHLPPPEHCNLAPNIQVAVE
eukprot:CAMPEP_0177749466 /NCGR_PEP_ID=MMETSP0484_2-20121128/32503_1 /TAXON_ID=354590 /ORGANISM="Rhodomonas lens, Strain RHODO" /LENGTH=136 /DNA_ID=CAMNT_0019264455 /DNA_START=188 /DNA_END=595 /DNA_ORIENTATION=+